MEENIIFKNFLTHFCLPLLGLNVDEIAKVELECKETGKSRIIKPSFDYFDNEIILMIFESKYIIKNIIIKEKIYRTMFEEMIHYLLFYIDAFKDYIPNDFYYHQNKKYIKNYVIDFENQKSQFYLNAYKNSIIKGISSFINNYHKDKIEKILSIIDKWSFKTYEGHKVCYGIVIEDTVCKDADGNNDYYGDFYDFFDDEYSAVISDGFSSIVILDNECKFLRYESITDGNFPDKDSNKNAFLPFRFFEIINQHVSNEDHINRTGIFLLQNSDIIISKNKEIEFIKRNDNWLNFNRFSFTNSLKNLFNYNNATKYYSEYFFPNVYSTTLDVSLAHTGGIIAIVDRTLFLDSNDKILNDIDNLFYEINNSEMVDYKDLFFGELTNKYKRINQNDDKKIDKSILEILENKDKNSLDVFLNSNSTDSVELKTLKNDIVKRLTKRKFILKLLNGKKKFTEIDKKLLAELIGLDGACIIDTEGNIISFGAIIINDSGSSGGGRGAAAKKLSKYEGFSIKISTDGYIEIYSKEKKVYSIK